MSHKVFWTRYFFKVHLIELQEAKRQALRKRAEMARFARSCFAKKSHSKSLGKREFKSHGNMILLRMWQLLKVNKKNCRFSNFHTTMI